VPASPSLPPSSPLSSLSRSQSPFHREVSIPLIATLPPLQDDGPSTFKKTTARKSTGSLKSTGVVRTSNRVQQRPSRVKQNIPKATGGFTPAKTFGLAGRSQLSKDTSTVGAQSQVYQPGKGYQKPSPLESSVPVLTSGHNKVYLCCSSRNIY